MKKLVPIHLPKINVEVRTVIASKICVRNSCMQRLPIKYVDYQYENQTIISTERNHNEYLSEEYWLFIIIPCDEALQNDKTTELFSTF